MQETEIEVLEYRGGIHYAVVHEADSPRTPAKGNSVFSVIKTDGEDLKQLENRARKEARLHNLSFVLNL